MQEGGENTQEIILHTDHFAGKIRLFRKKIIILLLFHSSHIRGSIDIV